MAKPEWGTKRQCLSCAARFYDLGRAPIVCPKCGTTLDLETVARARRPRPPVRGAAEVAVVADDPELAAEETVVAADAGDDDVEVEDEEAEAVIAEPAAEADEEEAPLIEDTDDLAAEDIEDVIDDDLEEDPDAPR
jgi:uncharacterized protein (TIGR02300 family)